MKKESTLVLGKNKTQLETWEKGKQKTRYNHIAEY